MKKIMLSILTILLSVCIGLNVDAKEKEESKAIECAKEITIHLFWGNGCPHCEAAIEYFDSIEETYGDCFKLEKHETWYDADNKELLEKVADYFGEDVSGVPYIVIGENTFSGYSSSLNEKLESSIISNANDENYIDVVEKVKNGDVTKSKKSDTVVTVTILLVAAIGIFALIKTSRA